MNLHTSASILAAVCLISAILAVASYTYRSGNAPHPYDDRKHSAATAVLALTTVTFGLTLVATVFILLFAALRAIP